VNLFVASHNNKNKEKAKSGIVEGMNELILNRLKKKFYILLLRFAITFFVTSKEGNFKPPD